MNAQIIQTMLEDALKTGDRVAVGFATRSFFVDNIVSVKTHPTGSNQSNLCYEVVGLVYDTGHSRQATPERIYFEAGDVVSIAVPYSEQE